MIEWLWNTSVDIYQWFDNGIHGWKYVIGVALMLLGGLSSRIAQGITGNPPIGSFIDDESPKTVFAFLLTSAMFPVMVCWCNYERWHEVSWFGHIFAWIAFLLLGLILLTEASYILRYIFKRGYTVELLFTLIRVVALYLGVVLCSKVIASIALVVIVIGSLLHPSGSSSSSSSSSSDEYPEEYNGKRMRRTGEHTYVDRDGNRYEDVYDGWGHDVKRK